MSPLHTFQQMVVVMILIGVGFVSCRRKMLSGTGLQNLSKLTADVFNPAIIFSSMVVHTEGQKPEFVGGIFLVAAAMFLVCIAVMDLLPDPVGRTDKTDRLPPDVHIHQPGLHRDSGRVEPAGRALCLLRGDLYL